MNTTVEDEWCWVIPRDGRRHVPYGLVLVLIALVSFPTGYALVAFAGIR